MLHRWAGFKCSRSEQTEFIGWCHTKAVSFAMFWESCVCLFFNTHRSGNQCFIYLGNELGNYITSYLTFPSLLFQGVKKVHYKKCFKPLLVAGHQHFIVPLMLTGLFSFLLVEKFSKVQGFLNLYFPSFMNKFQMWGVIVVIPYIFLTCIFLYALCM